MTKVTKETIKDRADQLFAGMKTMPAADRALEAQACLFAGYMVMRSDIGADAAMDALVAMTNGAALAERALQAGGSA